MDWNRLCLTLVQGVVVVVLGILVGIGRDGVFTDALLVICGSLAGTVLTVALPRKASVSSGSKPSQPRQDIDKE